MKCQKKRSLFNLFEIYTCENCKYNHNDEEVDIGGLIVNTYYLNWKCLYESIPDDIAAHNIKIKKLLIEVTKESLKTKYKDNEFLFVWLDNNNLINYEELLYDLLEFNMNIHILIQ